MQSPGRHDEDNRGGFTHGGWAAGTDDPEIADTLAAIMGTQFAWLFGHRSYDDMLGHWNRVGGPFADGLNAATKYVAVSSPDADQPWPNTVPLTGDIPDAVAHARDQAGGNLVVMGSGELIATLLERDLVDEILLMIHPVTLGGGRRLFPDDGNLRRWALVSVTPTPSGILLARYRAASA